MSHGFIISLLLSFLVKHLIYSRHSYEFGAYSLSFSFFHTVVCILSSSLYVCCNTMENVNDDDKDGNFTFRTFLPQFYYV